MARINPIKIGADPEFSFIDSDGSFVEASDVMSRVRSYFGLDGCDSIAELRPKPDINPSRVVKTIYNDLRRGYLENPNTRNLYWKAGSITEGYSTGGHIHFGLRGASTRGLCRSNEDYYKSLTQFLDTYLGQIGRLLEPAGAAARFADGEYGRFGDYRSNSHGMEYRVLGSWLSSPRVAEGILCLAQTVAYQHLWELRHKVARDISEIASIREYDEDEAAPSFREAMKLHRRRFPELCKQIRTFKLYKKHKAAIEFIFSLVEKKKTWFPGEGVDMKAAWGITPVVSSIPSMKKKVLPLIHFKDIWERASR